MEKKVLNIFIITLIILIISSCSEESKDNDFTASNMGSQNINNDANITNVNYSTDTTELIYSQASQITVEYSDYDNMTEDDINEYTKVVFNKTTAKIDGTGVDFNNGVLTITKSGAYLLSGTLNEGKIVVNVNNGKVQLILDNLNLTCTTDAPIIIQSADIVSIILKTGTKNYLYDMRDVRLDENDDDTINAAIYSKSDLTLNGAGELTIVGNYNHAIYCKKNLKIMNGVLNITSSNAGLKGKNSVVVKDGVIDIRSGGDAIKVSNETDVEKGYVYIEGGNININAKQDGISASLYLIITRGTIDITTTGEVKASTSDKGGFFRGMFNNMVSEEEETETASSKGIKSGIDMYLSNLTLTIHSTGHSIHSGDSAVIAGGNITIYSSSGKGISCHGDLTINDGTIDIQQSFEGIESKAVLTINGGTINIIASDDGFSAGGNQSPEIIVNGGYIYINSSGDGVDSNSDFTINDGVVIIAGPTNSGNGAIDASEGNITITGGILIAYGSAGMTEYPGKLSTQNVLNLTFSSTISAGTVIRIEAIDGNEIITFEADKSMQNVVFSSPKLVTGDSYAVYTGEKLYTEFTINDTVTHLGSSGNMGGRPGGMRR